MAVRRTGRNITSPPLIVPDPDGLREAAPFTRNRTLTAPDYAVTTFRRWLVSADTAAVQPPLVGLGRHCGGSARPQGYFVFLAVSAGTTPPHGSYFSLGS